MKTDDFREKYCHVRGKMHHRRLERQREKKTLQHSKFLINERTKKVPLMVRGIFFQPDQKRHSRLSGKPGQFIIEFIRLVVEQPVTAVFKGNQA